MKKITYNGEFVISISITESKEQKNWGYEHIKSKSYFWGLYKTKEIEGYYDNYYWRNELKDKSYFGWHNGNKKLYLKENKVFSYPRVYIRFLNDDYIDKSFETMEEAKSYYTDILIKTININKRIIL